MVGNPTNVNKLFDLFHFFALSESIFFSFSLLSVISFIIKKSFFKKLCQIMMGVYQFGVYLNFIFEKKKTGKRGVMWENK